MEVCEVISFFKCLKIVKKLENVPIVKALQPEAARVTPVL